MKRVSRLFLSSMIATVAIIGGCGDTRSEAERVADAQQQIAQAKYRGAIIDLRNVLQANPDSLEARLSLSRALIESGDAPAADKELQRAIRLGATPDQYLELLAQVLHARSAHAELISEVDPGEVTDPALASQLEAMRARAMLALGSVEDADAIFKKVLAAGESVEAQRIALLGIARMAFDRGDMTAAERYARQSFELAPDSAESFLRLGSLLITQKNFTAAKEHFSDENASGVRMTNLDRFRMLGDRAAAQVGLGELDDAAATASTMASLAPEHPMSAFMQGRIEFQRGNLDLAMEHLQRLNAKSPNYAPGQALLGAVSLQQGELIQAEEYLTKALALEPRNALARNMLAETKIRLSRPEDAEAMLRQAVRGDSDNPVVLAMLGRAAMQSGNTDAGIAYYRQSIENNPDSVELKLALSSALVSLGTQEARNEATAIIEGLPGDAVPQSRRNALLVIAQFDKDNPGPAKARLDALLAATPDDVSLQALAGNFYFTTGDMVQARASFERALELTPEDLGIAFSILRIDQVENDFTRSRALFEAARARSPRDIDPVLALAQIAGAEGDRQRSVELAREAQAIDETALLPNLQLVTAALSDNDLDAAESYARTALSANPNAARAHGAMGIVQSRRGLFREAAVSLRRATELDAKNFFLQYELARAQIADGQEEAARDSYAAAYELNKNNFETVRSLALLEIRTGNADRASALLDEARGTFGEGPILDQLKGEVRFEQERWSEALASFSSAYATAPSWELASHMYRTRIRMGANNPLASVTDWIDRQPDHAPARLTVAQYYERNGQTNNAIAAYEDLLERDLESPLVLNNLAWLYFSGDNDEKTAQAIEMAERAHRRVPDNAEIADTLGWIQFKSGQREAGVETLRKALANTTPKRSPEIAYHLAVALNARGADNEARETLLQALASSETFPSREEAQRLLDIM